MPISLEVRQARRAMRRLQAAAARNGQTIDAPIEALERWRGMRLTRMPVFDLAQGNGARTVATDEWRLTGEPLPVDQFMRCYQRKGD